MKPEDHWHSLAFPPLTPRQKLKLCWPLLAILLFLLLCAVFGDFLNFIAPHAPTMGYMSVEMLVALLKEWLFVRMEPIAAGAIFLAILFRIISRHPGK